jgi:hypothetical protein
VRLSVCDPRRKMKDGERGGKMKRYGRRCWWIEKQNFSWLMSR